MELVEPKLSNVAFDNQHPSRGDSRRELLQGLAQAQKLINPKYFYDSTGSELFDQITQLPEYYPSRTEMGIFRHFSAEIAAHCGEGCVLIEPGSGNSEKVRLLLDALRPSAYVPLDISAEFLYRSAVTLGREFPWLAVHAVCADFIHNWKEPSALPEGKRVVFYPGSTIGNFEPEEAQGFLSRMRGWMNTDGGALIGVDLHKSEQVLKAAYNDEQGVTAAFNLNVLDHINPLLGAEFDAEQFSHRAFYNTDKRRIEMHLVSDTAQTVCCDEDTISFKKGETIHTENSYKYTVESFCELAQRAGLVVRKSWLDEDELFSVHYLEQA